MDWIGLRQRFPSAFLALLLVLALSVPASPVPQDGSDTVQFTVQVVNERVTVGDAIEIRVKVAPDSIKLAEPDLSMDLGEFELLGAWTSQTYRSGEEGEDKTLVLTVTTFKTGDLEIPSIPVRYSLGESDEILTGSTKPIPIQVESVLPEDAQDILDIKPPLEIPKDWLLTILLSALIAALAVVAALLVRRHLKRRHTGQALAPPKPAVPPHVTAYEALEQLRQSKLLERGQLSQFYVRVSEIIRRYFEERFRIDALEMSTPELLRDLAGIGGTDEHLPLFQKFLDRCDLVKFAKFVPVREQSDRVFDLAIQIVDSTKQERLKESPQKAEEEADG